MSLAKIMMGVATALVLTAVFQSTANAQFGFPGIVSLPRDDFTWTWGELREFRLSTDFDLVGVEAGFRCELTGRLSPSSRMSQTELRTFESELSSSLYFIRATAEAMYVLDYERELEWAQLACIKPESEVDEEKTQQKVDKAREKAQKKQAERRARREREEAKANNQ